MKTTLCLTILIATCAAAIAAEEAAPAVPAAVNPQAAVEQAVAEAQGKTPEENLKRWDADGDGKVSYEEAAKSKRKMGASKVRAWFDKKDANKDGFLTLDELAAGKTK